MCIRDSRQSQYERDDVAQYESGRSDFYRIIKGTPDRRVDNRSYREGVERHVNPCKKRDRAQRERQSTCKKTAVCVDTCCFLSSSQRECYKSSSCEHECVIQDL